MTGAAVFNMLLEMPSESGHFLEFGVGKMFGMVYLLVSKNLEVGEE